MIWNNTDPDSLKDYYDLDELTSDLFSNCVISTLS